ncbi:uncharacterized protein [Ptychodera flava]|uniref:uncharacterized protein n=1 Tax=Ptychodera flava TaxID=63121 RepID=UPI00396A8735
MAGRRLNNHDGTRDVWCQIERLNVNVIGGCVNELKPASNSECHPPCVDPFSECRDGQCQCQDGMMSNGGQCFPNSGCKSDHHCVFEHSHCDTTTDKCVCGDGYVLYNGIGPCLKINQDEDVTTDVVESLLDKDSSKMQVNKNGDLWKYVAIAIGGLLAIVLVVIVAVILMMRRKRSNHGEVKATAKTVEFKHNNFDMNNYNNVNEKLSNIGKDTKPTEC